MTDIFLNDKFTGTTDNPKEFIKHGIKNLYRIELSNYWRMLYTLTDGESQIEIVAFVLDVLDHKDYDKKFGYK